MVRALGSYPGCHWFKSSQCHYDYVRAEDIKNRPRSGAFYLPIGPQVDAILKAWATDKAPGVAVTIIDRGAIVHARGYGLAHLPRKPAITPETVFDLASVSKQFTAMAIMILAERGTIALDDPLTKYFPRFPAYAGRITLRHLLHHTGGLTDYVALYEKAVQAGTWPTGYEPTAREIAGLLATVPNPDFPPSKKYNYSNSGYVMLGQVVEVATKTPFPTWKQANVFG